MQRLFLLLRDNKQTGPFSLDELIAIGLKNDDLIWIEGKSAAWSFPYEIDALKSYVPSAKPVEDSRNIVRSKQSSFAKESLPSEIVATAKKIGIGKKVHVTMPGNRSEKPLQEQPSQNDLFEQKAEELRRRAQNFTAAKSTSLDTFVETKYSRSLDDVEGDYTSWVVEKKTSQKRNFDNKKVMTILLFLFVIGASYFTVKAFVNDKDETKKAAVVNAPAPIKNEVSEMPEDVTAGQIIPDEPVQEKEVNHVNSKQERLPEASSQKTKKKNLADKQIDDKPAIVATPQVPISNQEVIEDKSVVLSESKEKKTLGKKIGGFFEKLKTKKPESATEEPTTRLPEANETRNAERREETEKQTTVDLTSAAELSSNLKASSWMMGIKGLKVTLRNKGSQTIQSATAEVRYYNDQDELLEKKTIAFSNIPPKKTVAVTAPDHRLADHVDFQLITAEGQR